MKKIKLRCRLCEGTGRFPNTEFERCKMPSLREEELNYFGYTPENCKTCSIYEECQKGEIVDCPQCEGQGIIYFDSMGWELIVEGED